MGSSGVITISALTPEFGGETRTARMLALIWPRSGTNTRNIMARKKRGMGEKDLDQLLTHYRGERRRLTFQLELARTAIRDLKKQRAALPKAAPKPVTVLPDGTVKRGPGRPRKGEEVIRPKRKPGRPAKRKRSPRALNNWDNAVINAIKNTARLLPKEDIMKHAKMWAATNEPALTAPEIEVFVTRALQKLSGQKKLLGTHHTGMRRGNHYGLIDWFFKSSGKLRKPHFDKLVIDLDSPEI